MYPRWKPTHAGVCDECGVERVLTKGLALPLHRDDGKPCNGRTVREGTIVELDREVMERIARNLVQLRRERRKQSAAR